MKPYDIVIRPRSKERALYLLEENKIEFNVVRKAMAKMSKAEINRSMINLLTFTDLSEMMINSCPSLVESLCGKELFIQRRATGIMNVPGKGQARQWPHYEPVSYTHLTLPTNREV